MMGCPEFGELIAIGALITAITVASAALAAYMVCSSMREK